MAQFDHKKIFLSLLIPPDTHSIRHLGTQGLRLPPRPTLHHGPSFYGIKYEKGLPCLALSRKKTSTHCEFQGTVQLPSCHHTRPPEGLQSMLDHSHAVFIKESALSALTHCTISAFLSLERERAKKVETAETIMMATWTPGVLPGVQN